MRSLLLPRREFRAPATQPSRRRPPTHRSATHPDAHRPAAVSDAAAVGQPAVAESDSPNLCACCGRAIDLELDHCFGCGRAVCVPCVGEFEHVENGAHATPRTL